MLKSTDSIADSVTKESLADIWSLASSKQGQQLAESDDKAIESVLFFMGGKQAGKTSLILRFLDREESPSPTVALEYTFGRKSRPMSSIKDVTDIWELAGGAMLSKLIDIPLSESNVHSCAFVLALDLSQPNTWIHLLDTFLAGLSDHIDKVLEGLEQRGSKRPAALRARSLKKYGTGHPESDWLRPSLVPLVIVGTKYDLLQTPDQTKIISRFLRFVAHTHGASLVYTSHKEESSLGNLKSILNQLAFKSPSSKKASNFDPSRPLYIVAGQDTLGQIGPLLSAEKSDTNSPSYQEWKDKFSRIFSQEQVSKSQSGEEIKFPEQSIDQLRLQKEEELDAFRKASERKIKDKAFTNQFSQWSTKKEKRKGASYSRTQAARMEAAA